MDLEKEGEVCEEIALRYQYSHNIYKNSLVFNSNKAKKSQLF